MKVVVLVGSSADRTIEVTMDVDPSALHSVLPTNLACDAGITLWFNGPVQHDGPTVNASLAYIELMGRNGAVPVVIDSNRSPVLGWTTLQCLGLRLSEDGDSLEVDRPYRPAMLGVRNG